MKLRTNKTKSTQTNICSWLSVQIKICFYLFLFISFISFTTNFRKHPHHPTTSDCQATSSNCRWESSCRIRATNPNRATQPSGGGATRHTAPTVLPAAGRPTLGRMVDRVTTVSLSRTTTPSRPEEKPGKDLSLLSWSLTPDSVWPQCVWESSAGGYRSNYSNTDQSFGGFKLQRLKLHEERMFGVAVTWKKKQNSNHRSWRRNGEIINTWGNKHWRDGFEKTTNVYQVQLRLIWLIVPNRRYLIIDLTITTCQKVSTTTRITTISECNQLIHIINAGAKEWFLSFFKIQNQTMKSIKAKLLL